MTYRWIDLGNGRKVYRKVAAGPRRRSNLSAPMLNRDQMDDLWHPNDGKHYSSKSEFRRVTKKHGGVEVGNDVQIANRFEDTSLKSDVAQAIREVKQGRKTVVTDTASEGWN